MDVLSDILYDVYGLPAVHIVEFLRGTEGSPEEYMAVSCHIDIRRVRSTCRALEKGGVLSHARGVWVFRAQEAFDATKTILERVLKDLPPSASSADDVVFACHSCRSTRNLADCFEALQYGRAPLCCDAEMVEQRDDRHEARRGIEDLIVRLSRRE